ncbi:hypothetical protein FKP32DRAFT_1572551, partial [Trametes sanguinea]
MDDCFAVLFTGIVKPTNEDYKRTPFIIRHRVVLDALAWLKRNHCLYRDVDISVENLAQYEDGSPPVYVIFRKVEAGTEGENNTAVYEHEDVREAVTADHCPFMVHALTAPELGKMSYTERLAYAVRYFDSGGRALGLGHEQEPQSIYHNVDLYPGMYPWLYPYGLGGFEN